MRQRYGDLPVVLVGHSLGARAAVLASSEDGVLAAVALNAYLMAGDDAVETRARMLFVHGTDDRIASFAKAETAAGSRVRRPTSRRASCSRRRSVARSAGCSAASRRSSCDLRARGYVGSMTTTPQEPGADPDIVPSGDPTPIPTEPVTEPQPGEDPGTIPDPDVHPL